MERAKELDREKVYAKILEVLQQHPSQMKRFDVSSRNKLFSDLEDCGYRRKKQSGEPPRIFPLTSNAGWCLSSGH